ncbi:MAG TPA: twin-arginine translocation signal domain-containing protein, partial [Gemmatimonadaceae bacterium]|nr:twin-arginine translocation signal domain-containing protein [Gemmatimonadaceae bacterium]
MSTSRRDFLRTSAAAAAAAGLLKPETAQAAPLPAFSGDSDHRELAMRAIDAARAAGASYADCRISSA